VVLFIYDLNYVLGELHSSKENKNLYPTTRLMVATGKLVNALPSPVNDTAVQTPVIDTSPPMVEPAATLTPFKNDTGPF